MHHLLQEGAKWLRRITHYVLNFISQFTIHFSFELVYIQCTTVVHDDVLCIICFIENQLEFSKVIARNQLRIVFFS